ncbi:MAG: tripartite tricarboxylate transporter permease [Clostridia bacterium]|nr:tripartite tricarboxylate transporter permease [Clostridia bacterium]
MNPQILEGLKMVASPLGIALMLGGVILGSVFGAIPGLTGSICIAIMLPITFGMDKTLAMALLVAIYVGASYGGSIAAILFGTPGTPESSMTVFDGHPMAQRGQAKKALNIALYSSAAGNLLSSVIMITLSVYIAKIALAFGAAEYASVILFSLVLIATLGSKGSALKGLAAVCVGLFISFIGPDPINATPRFSFGNINLTSSISIVPVLVGVFVGGEVLQHVSIRYPHVKLSKEESKAQNKITGKEIRACIPGVLSGTIIGSIMGALPALNASVSATLNYTLTKRFSKHPERFGTGIAEGIAAPEAANNATVGPALVPLLTLGIPGTGTAAILLGALMMQGVIPGPMIFRDYGEVVYGIFFCLVICTLLLVFGGKLVIAMSKTVLNFPREKIYPVIIMLCCVGAYCTNRRLFDVFILLVCMLVGYLMSRVHMPVLPLVIGYLLGSTFEKNLRQALLMSRGSINIFFKSAISTVFLALTAALVLWFVISEIMSIVKQRKQKERETA